MLLGAAAAPLLPIFEDPWDLLAHARGIHVENRAELAAAYLRLAGRRPPLDRDALIHAGKEVFNYTIGTARETVKREADVHSGASRVAPSVVTADFLAEMVYRPGLDTPLGYLVHRFDRPDDAPLFTESVATAVTKFVPPSASLLEAGVILLPSAAEEYGGDWDLFLVLRDYVGNYLQVDDPDFRALICCYILMTWLYDRFDTVPYLRAQGDFGTGKSRLLQVVGSVCYRPILAGGATTASPIFRIIDRFRGTLAIDEADFDKSDLWMEIVKILNAGYQRGFPVLRSERGADNEFDVRAYDCFGPKLLATRRRFNDEALESRCLSHTMPILDNLDQRVPLSLGERFRTAAAQLRNKLLMWRLRKWSSTLVNDAERLAGVEPRANQIVQPLIACTEDPRLRAMLLKMVHQYSRRVAAERRDSLPGLVAQALLTRWLKSGRPGSLMLKTVVEELQREHDAAKISHRRVSDVVRGNLGLTTEQRGGYAHVYMTPQQAANLAQRYSFDLSHTLPGQNGVVVRGGGIALPPLDAPGSEDPGPEV